MQKLLFKRTMRDLKANAFRYLALFFLVALAMFLIISTIGSAGSVIKTVDENAITNHLEDGQFHLFAPLKSSQLEAIRTMDITLEECFYLDFSLADASTLRVMKNRTDINTVTLEQGALATAANEIVIERIYAAAHDIQVGDSLPIAGGKYLVTGIGTSPDYDNCLQTMSSMSSDGNLFGTAFVTAAGYEQLQHTHKALHAEEYGYSYWLNNNANSNTLKNYLRELNVTPDEINDAFFQEQVADETKDRDEFTDGVQQLADGSDDLCDALETLTDGTASMKDGINTIHDGLAQLHSNSSDLTDGSAEVLSALTTLANSLDDMDVSTASITQLQDASAQLLSGIKQLNTSMQQLSGQVNYQSFESLLGQKGVDTTALSPDAMLLLGAMKEYLTGVNGALSEAAAGSDTLHTSFQSFDQAIAGLPTVLEQLNSGLQQLSEAISTLCTEYQTLDTGINTYTSGVDQLYDGYAQLNDGAKELNTGANELSENAGDFRSGVKELQTETTKLLDEYFAIEIPNLTSFVTAADNPRIKASSGDVVININVGIWAGVIVLILITYVISVFVIHSIDQESSMIGALYALGLKGRQLIWHYTMLPVLLCLVGGIIGTMIGFSNGAAGELGGDTYAYFSIPTVKTYYSPWLLAYGLVMPPLIAGLVNWLIIRKRLKRTALSLLRQEPPEKKTKQLRLTKLNFIHTFQVRQFLREQRSCFAVLAGMFISLLLLVLGLNCFSLCLNLKKDNSADTKYEYMYQYKYPPKTALDGGYEAYVVSLNKELMGYNNELSIIGLARDNPYFPAITSTRKNEISISNSVATKYKLSVGDKLVLSDEANEREYGFTVKEIVCYSPGLCCFMDINSMRTLFDQEDDYYNVVYSDHDLAVETGRLYALATRVDIIKSSDVFMENMLPMMRMMTVVAILMFLIVMYQMIKVMVDRSALNISLMKVFGYRDKEVRKLYLDGNFLLIAVGALLLIPLSKKVMDALYPSFIANISCGMNLTWPTYLYAVVYVGIVLCYLVIRTVLMRKLKRVLPAEILKSRE